jgi:hypothetical protein
MFLPEWIVPVEPGGWMLRSCRGLIKGANACVPALSRVPSVGNGAWLALTTTADRYSIALAWIIAASTWGNRSGASSPSASRRYRIELSR